MSTNKSPTVSALVADNARRLGYKPGMDVSALRDKRLDAVACYKMMLLRETDPAMVAHYNREIRHAMEDRDELLRLELEDARNHLERVLSAVESHGSIFVRMGRGVWVVQHARCRAMPIDQKGMAYIHTLIQRAATPLKGEGLTPLELRGQVNLLPGSMQGATVEAGEDSPTPGTQADRDATDYADNAELRRRLKTPEAQKGIAELKGKLLVALRNGDVQEAKAIRKVLRLCGEGDPKRTRRPPDPTKEKARDSVRRAIDRALSDIERENGPAGKYLRKHIKPEGGRWYYSGDAWTT